MRSWSTHLFPAHNINLAGVIQNRQSIDYLLHTHSSKASSTSLCNSAEMGAFNRLFARHTVAKPAQLLLAAKLAH